MPDKEHFGCDFELASGGATLDDCGLSFGDPHCSVTCGMCGGRLTFTGGRVGPRSWHWCTKLMSEKIGKGKYENKEEIANASPKLVGLV